MIKLTVRRLCLGGIALALSVLSLLSLLFAAAVMDLSQFKEVLQDYGLFFRPVEENGFALLDGRSDIISFFEDFAVGWSASTGVDVSLPSLNVLEIFSQVFNILILICSILMCMGSVLWLFFVKSERLVKTISLVSIWVGAVYLIEGLLFVLFLNSEWKTLLDSVSESLNLFWDSIFSTRAFIPLILIIIFEVLFWCFYYKIGAEHPVYDAESAEAEPVEFAGGETAKGYYETLKRLKELYDDGILTEQEFNNEKTKILNKTNDGI